MANLKKNQRSDVTTPVALTSFALQNANCRRSMVALILVALVWLYSEVFSTGPRPKQGMLLHNNRCLDPEDPTEWNDIPNKSNCQCPDPTKPSARGEAEKAWYARHQILIQDAEYMSALELEHGQELDLVLLGDSITERWNRTQVDNDNDYRPVFNRFFDKTKDPSAPLQSLALGTSGDITTELLWHLQNGMMPDTLRPKAWLLLIGTNDLGRSGCSKRTVLSGILQVAEYIRKQRPGTPIILHGLLPRNDVYAPAELQTDYTLGRYWDDIVWVNAELAKFGELHHEWSYMEAGNLFLTNETSGSTVTTRINRDLMTDALHPNPAGCKVWAPVIVDHVLKIIRPPDA